MPASRPLCSWSGLGEDDEEEVFCERPATCYVDDATGRRHFACDEHAGEVRVHAGGGELVRGAQHADEEGRMKYPPERAIRWE